MRLCGKERHLAFRIAAVRTVRVSFDEFPDGEAIRSLSGGNSNVLAHKSLKNGFRFKKRLDSKRAKFTPNT